MKQFLNHIAILLDRNLHLFIADKTGMWLALLQAPFIALFISLALYGSGKDCETSDKIMRKSHAFIQAVEKDRPDTEVMYEQFRINRGFSYVLKAVDMDSKEGLLSPTHAQARATIFFVMISASIWMWLLGSCKEIVTEWKVIHRESHSAFSTGAYVLSKLCILGVVLLFQVFCLTLISMLILLKADFTADLFMGCLAVNWLAGFGACATGLFLSCIISSIRWALALVPVIMMPQILMGGLLRPPAQVLPEQRSVLRQTISALTFQRWAFEAALVCDTRLAQSLDKEGNVDLKHRVALLRQDENENSLLYQPKCDTPALDDYFFIGGSGSIGNRLRRPLVALTSYALLMGLLTDVFLVLRIIGANHGNRLCA